MEEEPLVDPLAAEPPRHLALPSRVPGPYTRYRSHLNVIRLSLNWSRFVPHPAPLTVP